MAPGSVELMDVEINKTLNESYKRAQTILKTHRFNKFYTKRNHYIHICIKVTRYIICVSNCVILPTDLTFHCNEPDITLLTSFLKLPGRFFFIKTHSI